MSGGDNSAGGYYDDKTVWHVEWDIPGFAPVHGHAGSKVPWAKRKAKRRRKTALAKHHKKCMRLAAAGHKTFPKRPPKARR